MARYREIADDLRRRIQAGDWKPGYPLPALEALVDQYGGPSMGTVRAAEQHLVEQGLLRVEPGKGAFVLEPSERDQRAVALAALRRMRADLDEAIRALEAESS